MRFKILFISSWFPSKIEPTNGNFVQRHAEAVSRIHEVEILHAIRNPEQKTMFIYEEKIVNDVRTLIVYYKQSKFSIINFYRRMKAFRKGFQHMEKPDLVHANILQRSMLFAVYLKNKFQIPFVVTEHWSGLLGVNRHLLSNINLRIARYIAKQAAFVLPVSQYLLRDLKEVLPRTSMAVVENVVDTEMFWAKTGKQKLFSFLHISNLVSIKNPDMIISAAVRLHQEYPNFELHIGGDGDVAALNERVKQNKAQDFVKLFSTLTGEEVALKMRSSNCFILMSDYENFPCVLLEALSCGTPVIATNVGGVPEIINETNGILISKSEDELYQAMKKVLLHLVRFDEPVKLHQSIETRFSQKIISDKFDKIYRKVLSGYG